MKKLLALVLALVMTLSLCVTSNAAFAGEEYDYDEAVEVMAAVGVFQGDENGKFNGKAELTREQAAKLIAYLDLGEKVAEALPAVKVFNDVEATRWSAKYVAYCADAGYLAGVGDNNFDPAGKLTGYAFGKMLLCALGYDASIEGFTGANWSIAVAKLMQANDINADVEATASAALTREQAAQYCLNALKADMVEYKNKGTQVTINGAVIATGASAATKVESTKAKDYRGSTKGDEVQQLCEKLYGADLQITAKSADAYGRPAHEWKYKKDAVNTYADAADFTFTAKTKAADMAATLEGYTYKSAEIKDSKTDAGAVELAGKTANGKLVELYLTDDVITKVVEIETYIAQVTSVTKDKASTKDVDERAFAFGGYTVKYEDDVIDNFDAVYEAIEKDDYVLYTLNTSSKIASVTVPETVKGVVSKSNADEIVVGGTTYKYSQNSNSVGVDKAEQEVWLDTYGYVMRGEKVADEVSDVVYLVKTYESSDKYNVKSYFAQIVTAEGEVEEIEIIVGDKDLGKGAYTYTTNSDDQADLTAATETEAKAVSAAIAAKDAKVGSNYFADSVTFVYIEKEGAKLKVTTADGVQKVSTMPENSYVVLNKDKEITTVFVASAADTTVKADDLLFVADTESVGTALDLKNKSGNTYKFYAKGEKQTEIVDKTIDGIGFYSYTVDSATGVYTLTKETKDVKTGLFNIAQNKYLTIDTSTNKVTDGVLASDCAIYDLTDNDADTLADIATLVKDGVAVNLFALYDSKEEEFTCIYVVEAGDITDGDDDYDFTFTVGGKAVDGKSIPAGTEVTVNVTAEEIGTAYNGSYTVAGETFTMSGGANRSMGNWSGNKATGTFTFTMTAEDVVLKLVAE